MFKTALKSLLGHKLRLAITVLAIVLGVGFMAGTFVLTDTLKKTFDDLFTTVGEGTDAVIRSKSVLDQANNQGPLRADVDPALARVVAEVPGVKGAEPQVQSLAKALDRKCRVIGGGGAPNLGFNWPLLPELNTFELVEGKAPVGPDQVVVSRGIAKDGPYKLGDRIPIQTLGATLNPRISGIATFNGEDSAVGATFVGFDTPTAVKYLTFGGKVQEIDVVAEPGVSQAQVAANIAPMLPKGLEVLTGTARTDENKSDLEKQLSTFNVVLGVFALISLIAGAFLIYNTFGIIVTQRTRELALLRAMGASRGQVLGSVVLEAGAIGFVSSLIGLAVGVLIAKGLFAVFKALGLDLPSTAPVLAPRTIIVCIGLGLFITVASALMPAWRAARLSPMAALRDVGIDTGAGSVIRLVAGLVLLALGALVLLGGINSETVSGVAFGLMILFIATIVLGPRVAPSFTRAAGFLYPRLAGAPGRLARENAARSPKRSASTASALLLAVMLVTTLSIFAFSFGKSINAATDRYFRGDFQLDEGGFGIPSISPATVAKVKALPEVGGASGIQLSTVGILGKPATVYGVNGADADKLWDIGLTEGSLAQLGTDGVALDNATATLFKRHIGSTLNMQLPDGTTRPFTVKALYDNAGIIAQDSNGHYLLDSSAFAKYLPAQSQFASRVAVKGAPGVPSDKVRAALEGAVASNSCAAGGAGGTALKVRDVAQIKEEQNRQLNQSLTFLVMLLVLTVVIGALGIANTLALAVFERTRELGLIRAVGASRRQVNVSILLEAILLSLFGTAIGMLLGIAGGIGLMQTFGTAIPTTTVNIPIPFLVAVVVLALVIALVSSIIPSWRASRLNVLAAIASE